MKVIVHKDDDGSACMNIIAANRQEAELIRLLELVFEQEMHENLTIALQQWLEPGEWNGRNV
jgi:hypothetical protein